jgi:hypothetical protein
LDPLSTGTIERKQGKERRSNHEEEKNLRKTTLDMVSILCTFFAPSSSLYVSQFNGVCNRNPSTTMNLVFSSYVCTN